MARPRRRTQGLLSSLAGQGAGKGRRRKSRSQCGMCRRQQGMAGSAWGRRGYSKEKTEDGRKMPFVCNRWRNRPKAGQVLSVISSNCKRWWRMCRPDFLPVKRLSLSFVKKQPGQKPGDRHQGKGPGAGQAVRDLMERFWKGEGAWGRGRTFSPKRFPSPPRLIFKLQWQPRS